VDSATIGVVSTVAIAVLGGLWRLVSVAGSAQKSWGELTTEVGHNRTSIGHLQAQADRNTAQIQDLRTEMAILSALPAQVERAKFETLGALQRQDEQLDRFMAMIREFILRRPP